MTWKRTLPPLIVLLLILIYVLGREGGHDGESRARLAAGLLYPHPAESIRRVELAYPERTLRLELREDGGRERWWLTAPVEDSGDSVVIGRMLATLGIQEVARWLPPVTGEGLAEFGLDAPNLEMRLETRTGWDTLRFGDLNPVEKKLWVQCSWRDSLALVPTLLRTHAMKGRYQLAEKRPMGDLPRSGIESLEIHNARGRFTLAKGKRGWEIQRPESYRADDRTVRRMLDRLWGESIIDLEDDADSNASIMGFNRPRAVMRVNMRGETHPRVLELGRKQFELNYARNGDRDHAFLLDSTTVTPLLESFSAFMSTVLVSFLPGRVLEIGTRDGAHAVKVDGPDWQWKDASGAILPAGEISVTLTRLLRLPTGRVEALLPRRDQLEEWGLAPPVRAYRLELEGGGKREVEIGRDRDGRIAVRRPDYPTVYSVPAEALDLPWP